MFLRRHASKLQVTKQQSGRKVPKQKKVSTSSFLPALVLRHPPAAAAPNFITEVFYLTVAFNHYGLVRVIQELNDLEKEYGQLQRHVNMLNADTSWQGVSFPITNHVYFTKCTVDPTPSSMGSPT